MSVQSFLDGRVVLHGGDCRDVIKSIADASIDAIVTDPPYALVSIQKRFGKPGSAPTKDGDVYARASAGFMGQQWDTGETAFAVEFWREALRVLKPGGHVIAFAGTRTYHRLACAIEDAGFEIRDMISWLYGSGFPKSLDVSKAIDKAVGAQREVVGKSPHFANRSDKIGTNAYGDFRNDLRNITAPATAAAKQWQGFGTALKPACEPMVLARKPLIATVAANVLAHRAGALNIDGCRIHADDAQGGAYVVRRLKPGATLQKSGGNWRPEDDDAPLYHGETPPGRWPANVAHDGSDEVLAGFEATRGAVSQVVRSAIDTAEENAARFFYSAKADALDRVGSRHPTVKPVDLMQWLVRLITPPGGTVLDPFSGSGTTGEAAWREGFNAILIEREEEYRTDIARRMALCTASTREKREAAAKHRPRKAAGAAGLFDLAG